VKLKRDLNMSLKYVCIANMFLYVKISVELLPLYNGSVK
jgi:hypothetical protein